MSSNGTPEVPQELSRFRTAWETYDNTGDDSLLKEALAENVVHVWPGEEPIAGRDELLESLPDVTDREWEFESNNLTVSGDLAVEQFTITWRKETEDGGVEKGSIDSVDVYQRDEEGTWKQIISLPRRPE